jgi:hypothetical protein
LGQVLELATGTVPLNILSPLLSLAPEGLLGIIKGHPFKALQVIAIPNTVRTIMYM